jgi:hypothetical protein
MKKFTLRLLLFMLTLLTGNMIAQNLSEKINQQLTQLVENHQLMVQDIQWELSSEHVSSASAVHHLYYSQMVNNIEVYGTQSSLHVLTNGKILSKSNNFIKNVVAKLNGSATPSLNAIQAVQAAANQLNYQVEQPLTVLSQESGANQEVLISDGGMSLSPIPAKLMYQLYGKEQISLVWDISIQEKSQQDWWNVRIDANTGAIVDQNNYMVSCSLDSSISKISGSAFIGPRNKKVVDNTVYASKTVEAATLIGNYRVYAMPIESPYNGDRELVVDPDNATASPFGWHDTDGIAGAESTLTTGNNVDAHKGTARPDGTAALIFDFPIDLTQNPASNTAPYITNLFYLNNILHDVLYMYGFDETSGNFQENNYGNGGAGSDSVDANAQAPGDCNANFGTPPDGQNPTMNMFLCSNTSPSADGDLDNGVIAHEFGHGWSIRLTGGAANSGCLNNSEQMGEGWSDFLGMVLTIEPGDQGIDYRGMGTYLFGQGLGGPGIRPYPYSTDFAINPQTYGDICGLAVPHGVGSVWATTLWEVTWALIDEHGFDSDLYSFTGDIAQDSGNIQAIALVTEAMKLQPCNPGFIDGRDAIFAADLAIYGGANECLLWDAFALRGLGASASQGGSGSTCDGAEAFDSPVPAISSGEEVCVSSGTQTYGGGTPLGGIYSGPGVTDDGNGLTYTFDPAVAGIGTHTIEYAVTTACSSGSAFDDLQVITDVPEITCQDFTLELDANGEATLTMHDVVTNLEPGVASFTEDFDFGLPAGWSTVVNTGNCDWINTATPPNGDSFGSPAMVYDDDDCGNNAPASNVSLLSDVYDVAANTIITLGYEVGFQEFGDGQTFVTEVWDGAAWQQVALVDDSLSPNIQTVSIDVSAYANAAFQVRWTYDDNVGDWGWYAGVDSFHLDYDIPGGPADNCDNVTSITLSQELFTCTDLGTNTITVTITDTAGNTNTCTSTITITDPLAVCVLGIEENKLAGAISLFPNPTSGTITLLNNSNMDVHTVTIMDINGRILQLVDIDGTTTNFSIASLAYGIYFVKIETDIASIVKRIAKN